MPEFRQWMLPSLVAWLLPGWALAQDGRIPPMAPASPTVATASPAATQLHPDAALPEPPGLVRDLLELVLYEAIPREHRSERKWGTTKEVFDGWSMRADGLKIYTKRKKKRVNHGTWKRYELKLVDPKQYLRLQLEDSAIAATGRDPRHVAAASAAGSLW